MSERTEWRGGQGCCAKYPRWSSLASRPSRSQGGCDGCTSRSREVLQWVALEFPKNCRGPPMRSKLASQGRGMRTSVLLEECLGTRLVGSQKAWYGCWD